MNVKNLIVGCGQVGRALMSVLEAPGYDPQAGYMERDGITCDTIHVCFPYSEGERPPEVSTNVWWQNFHKWVRDYQSLFQPKITVIHSTVPIGTSDSLNANHSPIRGRHPQLADSIRAFVKYVGGPQAQEVCAELRSFGIDARPVNSSRDTEAAKLLDLMQFAASIAIEKEIHEFCGRLGLDFDLVYREFNASYNAGYSEMGSGHFVRPVLDHTPGPIGGHCIIQNMKHIDSETARRVLDLNGRYASSAADLYMEIK